jgi:hypothetical protein
MDSLSRPPVIIDFTDLHFRYFVYPEPSLQLLYNDNPGIYTVLRLIKLSTMIQCSFAMSNDIPDGEQYVWDFIAENLPEAQACLEEGDYSLLQAVEFIMMTITMDADAILKDIIKRYVKTDDYGRYIFQRWLGTSEEQLHALFVYERTEP